VQLVLVRHALPERVQAGLGTADPPLTAHGRAQAQRLVAALAPDAGGSRDGTRTGPGPGDLGGPGGSGGAIGFGGSGVVGLYTSPMARARATAAPLAAALGATPVVVEDLREFDAEMAHYVPIHEMARLDPAAWDRIRVGLLPDYVDVPAFTARVTAALERVVAAHEGRATAVVVAHAGVINTWLAHLLGIARPLAFPLDYAGISRVVAARDGRRSVRTVNEIAHVADLLAPVAGATEG
jgi:2,3-bisphosphoglycerate-dependent phosphoglycerate mutase